MILQLKNAFFALIIISFFVFANVSVNNLSANKRGLRNIHTAAVIPENLAYNVYTSGEGSYIATPGTYTITGDYNLTIDDLRIEWYGTIPMWGNFNFIRENVTGLENTTIRNGRTYRTINKYSSPFTIFYSQVGSLVYDSKLQDPSGDNYTLHANINYDVYNSYSWLIPQIPFYGSYYPLGVWRDTANITFELTNGTKIIQTNAPTEIIPSAELLLYPERIWFTMTFCFDIQTGSGLHNWTDIGIYARVLDYYASYPTDDPLIRYFDNGSIHYAISPVEKFFNITQIGNWWRVDIDILSLIAYNNSILVDEIINKIKEAKREGFAPDISLDLYFLGLDNLYFDSIYAEMTGSFVMIPEDSLKYNSFVHYSVFVDSFDSDFVKIEESGIISGSDKFIIDETIGIGHNTYSMLDAYMKTQYGVGIAKATYDFYNDTETIANLVRNHHTIWYYINNYRVYFDYNFKSQISREAEPKMYYFYDEYEFANSLETRIYKLHVEDNITDAIVFIDDIKHTVEAIAGELELSSALAYKHSLRLQIYKLTKVTIQIVDSRGADVSGTIKLQHRDTARKYTFTTASPITVYVSSGVFSADVRVLLHEETKNISVTLAGGILTIRLSVDMRAIAGETIRALLLYIPVALLIPLIFMFPSIPLLVRKRK